MSQTGSHSSTLPAQSKKVGPDYRASRTALYYSAKANETFNASRYVAVRMLGGGRYSHVWLAKDTWYVRKSLDNRPFSALTYAWTISNDSLVALKILTSDCYGAGHDIFELDIMRRITQQQVQLCSQATHVISLTDNFSIDGPTGSHECMALPLLGSDLSYQARRFPKRRIPVSVMKQITRQLLEGLRFLHETCGVIHTGIFIQEYGNCGGG